MEARGRIRAWAAHARYARSLRGLPPDVALFMLRARRRALRDGDVFSLASAIRPRELRSLLELARGRGSIVELGTGTAWSTIALALAEPRSRVSSYDPVVRSERESYLALVRGDVRERIELLAERDSEGPQGREEVDLLFIDSEHNRDPVMAAFRAWRPVLGAGALVVFHDYDHPSYPGVREAVTALGLDGHADAGLFIWAAPSQERAGASARDRPTAAHI